MNNNCTALKKQFPKFRFKKLGLLGAEIFGLQLKQSQNWAEEIIESIRNLVSEHRLLIFKQQASLNVIRLILLLYDLKHQINSQVLL